jgi:hypothetical protein
VVFPLLPVTAINGIFFSEADKINCLRWCKASSCRVFKTSSTSINRPSAGFTSSSTMAYAAPADKAWLANWFALKLGPFKAKNRSPSLSSLVSVFTEGYSSYILYNSGISMYQN